MSRDLYKRLSDPGVLKIAANYVHDDKKDDFIPDVFRNQDYIFNLPNNLRRLAQSLKTGTYRPTPLKEIDVPKSGLGVRPGSVLDIEDHIVYFAIAYLLAPVVDRALPDNVFHFRVKKKGKRPDPENLFINAGPVLIRKVLRQQARIFEDWYEAWPEFVAEAQSLFENEGFTIMVESDISAFFENISHPLLADILREHAPQQLRLINLLMEMLAVWATPSLTGFRPQRGIPQGNDVSSWLGTLYLVQMDIDLLKLQRKGQIKYVRYVDDIKVFTKDRKTARSVVFMINRILRCLHLNMQSSKTQMFEGPEVRERLYDERVEEVTNIINQLPEDPTKITQTHRRDAEKSLKPVFKAHLAYKREMDKEDIRLFKRSLTLLGRIQSPMAVRQSMRWIWKQPALTEKVARYLSLWMSRKMVREGVEAALLGEEELFDTQYLYLLPMLRGSAVLDLKHRAGLMRLGCGGAYHWAVRAEALLSLMLYRLEDRDFNRLQRRYFKETCCAVRKTILALFLKAPDRIKRPMFAATIQEPDQETNRFRKYIWALANSSDLGQQTLAILRRVENDPARLLAALYGALQSHNTETLRQVAEIADERASSRISKLACLNFSQISVDAKRMIDSLAHETDFTSAPACGRLRRRIQTKSCNGYNRRNQLQNDHQTKMLIPKLFCTDSWLSVPLGLPPRPDRGRPRISPYRRYPSRGLVRCRRSEPSTVIYLFTR
ncbi:MAG: RNA-directed DNA polymerase [Syntrophales bacterium LBB04]|nr:RNA-directed DNA polymerase [Syntrophales bacterium LBB04]